MTHYYGHGLFMAAAHQMKAKKRGRWKKKKALRRKTKEVVGKKYKEGKTRSDTRPISNRWRVSRGSKAGGLRSICGWTVAVMLGNPYFSRFYVIKNFALPTSIPINRRTQPLIVSLCQRLKRIELENKK